MSDLFKAIGLQDESGPTVLRAFADPVNPDEAARSQEVARALGLPPAVVRSDLPGFTSQAEFEAAQRALKGKPRLIDWLDDPENAAIGRDDLETMGTLEEFGTSVWRGGRRGVKNIQAIPPVMNAFQLEQAVRDQGKTVEQLRAEILEGADSSQRPWAMDEAKRRWMLARRYSGDEAQERGRQALERAGQLRKEAAAIPQTPAGKRFVESEAWKAALEEEDFLGGLVAAAGALASDPEGASQFLAGVFGEMLPVLGASVATTAATGSPLAGVTVMGVGSAGVEAQAEAQEFFAENGLDISTPEGARAAFLNTELMQESARRGLTKGAIVGISDAISGGVAGRAMASSPIGDIVLQSIAQMVLGGGGEALGSLAASGEVSGADVFLEAIMELPGGVVETLGVAGRRYGKEVSRAAAAGQTGEVLKEVDATVSQSKLAARSPEKFREFLETTDMGQLSLSVPAEDLRTFYQAKDVPVDFEGLGIEQTAYEDALLSGGDVSIKASVYASRISGTEDAAWFHDNATLSVDEMSVTEAKRFNEEVETIIREDAERAETEFRAEMDARASDAQVRDAMFSQLREAGHSPDVAEREAAVWGAFFRTMGERYGEDSLELARQFGVRVEGPQAAQTRTRGELDIALNTLREAKPQKKPLRGLVREAGGIDPDSEFGRQMRSRGLTDPGLYKKGGAKLDSLVAAEHPLLSEFPDLVDKNTGLINPDAFIEALNDETKGQLLLPAVEREQERALAELSAEIERAGLTLDASNDEIAAALGVGADGVRFAQAAQTIPLAPKTSGATVRLFHGTTEEAARLIKEEGAIRLPAYLTPDRDAAESYADGGVVIEVDVPQELLMIDLDLPGGKLLSVEGAAGYLGDDSLTTIDDFLERGYSVGVARQAVEEESGRTLNQAGQAQNLGAAFSEEQRTALLDAVLKYNRNPRKYVNSLIKEGALPESMRDLAIEFATAAREIHSERARAGRGLDKLEIAKLYRPKIAEDIRARKKFLDTPMAQAWKKDFADRIEKMAGVNPAAAEKEARLATIEAIVREAKKRGFTVRYTSKSGSRASSRYIIAPDGTETRISDHYLPDSPQRMDRGGKTRWNDEIVVDDWRNMSIEDYFARMREQPRTFNQSPPVDSEAFRNWFKDSKVVDENGNPLVVYHGTVSDVEAFEKTALGKTTGAESARLGHFFVSDARTAASYAQFAATDLPVKKLIEESEKAERRGDFDTADQKIVEAEQMEADFDDPQNRLRGQTVMPLYLSIQNPVEIDAKGESFIGAEADITAAIKRAKRDGHDGVIIRNLDDAVGLVNQVADHFVAFESEQIKSVHNVGTFDPSDPRILFQPAFHGSPHTFERFRLSDETIGTGEGAQAFGWGLYFAGREDIARYYRDALSGKIRAHFERDGKKLSAAEIDKMSTPGGGEPEAIVQFLAANNVRSALKNGNEKKFRTLVVEAVADLTGRANEIAARVADRKKNPPFYASISTEELERQAAWALKKAAEISGFSDRLGYNPEKSTGRLYKVDVPEDSELWNWDVPLADQPKKIRNLFAAGGVEVPAAPAPIKDAAVSRLVRAALKADRPENVEPVIDSDSALYHEALDLAEERGIDPDEVSPGEFIAGEARDYLAALQAREDFTGAKAYRELAKQQGGDKEASMFLLELGGIKGHKFLDAASRDDGDGSYNYVIYDDTAVKILEFEQGSRGQIEFPAGGLANGETVIRLFESADLSTLLHESGHFFLEAFRSLATREDTPQAMLDDLSAIDKWLGRDESDTSAYTTEQQEQWARGFEAYLMEGKAPSLELAEAFARFKAWLTRIYRTVRGLNVEMTPEIRDVMDRMLATDREIAAARDQAAMDPLFSEAPPGMTQAEFNAYQRLAQRATQKAEQTLLEKVMEKVRREKEAWYREERKAVREEVEAEVNKRREYRLVELLANQRWLDGGEDIPDVRLNRKELVDRFGAGVIAEIDRTRLGGKRAIYADDGSPIDMVASMFGFRGADEMIQVLQNTRKRRETINTETDKRMAERHGDPLHDGTIEEEALAAIHTEEQAKTVAAEARSLAKRTGKDTRNITARIFRQRARAMLGRMRVADVRSARFLQAERQAARAAQKEFARVAGGAGREALEAAQRFKEKQLINHYLYSEARILEAEVARGRERMRRYENKKVREKLAGGYIEQIDAILEGYEFRKRTRRDVVRMENLAGYIQRMTEAGRANELNIDARLLEDSSKRHYTRLTVDEIRGLFDTVENIDHMGRFKQKLIDAKEKRDLDAVVETIRGAFRENVRGRPPSRIETRTERNLGRGRDFLNLTLNADTLLREIDGFKDLGAVWRNLKEAVDRGSARVAERREKIAEDFNKLYGVYSAKEQRAMGVKKKIDGVDLSLTKWDIIAIALNTGNEENYDRLVRGGKHAIPAEQVEAALATLDERDWRFVQSAWDYLETFWPEISAKEKRLTGVDLKKVEAKPMVPAHPFVRGGYYPIRYDSRLSGTVGDLESRELAETMMAGSFGKAQTKNGHTKARAEHVGRPLQLSLSVMHGHVDQVVRDLELGEPLANAWRILQDSRIKEAFLESGKRSDFEALELWLLDSAAGDTISARGFEAFLRHMRTGFTISRLALNVSTALIQPSGLFQSAVQLGKKTMIKGMAEYVRNPGRWLKEVTSVSSLMRERERTFQRDVLHAMNAADNAAGPATSQFQQFQRNVILPFSFILIQKMQFYVVDMPTWVSAYQKELGRSGNESDAVTFADSMVRRAQGSGLITDRGMLERGTTFKDSRQKELPRMLTALGSYMFAKFNIAYERAGKTNFRSPVEAVSFAVDMALLFTMEAVVYALAKGQWPDDDDDENMAVWMAKETGLSAMGTLPYLRELSGVMQGFGAGGIQGGITEALARPVAQIRQGEFDKGLIKSFWNASAILLHLPGSQVSAMIDAIFDDDLRRRTDTAPIEYLIRQN